MPILPHLRRQMSPRIGIYSEKTSSLYLRQPRQSLNLGIRQPGHLDSVSLGYGIAVCGANRFRYLANRHPSIAINENVLGIKPLTASERGIKNS